MHHPGKNRTYPLKLILDAVSTFNLGYSITDTRSVLRRHFHVDVPDRTINSWLTAYRSVSTYARLRAAGKKLFDPRSIIASRFFEHRQVYRFQVHYAKLELSLQSPIHHHLSPLRGYLTAVQRGPRGWAQPARCTSSATEQIHPSYGLQVPLLRIDQPVFCHEDRIWRHEPSEARRIIPGNEVVQPAF